MMNKIEGTAPRWDAHHTLSLLQQPSMPHMQQTGGMTFDQTNHDVQSLSDHNQPACVSIRFETVG